MSPEEFKELRERAEVNNSRVSRCVDIIGELKDDNSMLRCEKNKLLIENHELRLKYGK